MKVKQSRNLRALGVLAAGIGLVIAINGIAADASKERSSSKPKIEILKLPEGLVPGDEKKGEIKGKVSGLLQSKGYSVAIYARGGNLWWVQPTVDQPLTKIDSDGEFTANIHGGEDYAALLVKDTYKPAATCERLPEVKGEVLACARKKPEKTEE
jgi:hypothetical protein